MEPEKLAEKLEETFTHVHMSEGFYELRGVYRKYRGDADDHCDTVLDNLIYLSRRMDELGYSNCGIMHVTNYRRA